MSYKGQLTNWTKLPHNFAAAIRQRYDMQKHGSSVQLNKLIWTISAVQIAITQQR